MPVAKDMSTTVTIEGREVARVRPDELENLDKHQALMLRLAGAGHLDKDDLRVMIEVSAGYGGAREYMNVTFEAVHALACEMYGFHPETNPPDECPAEDYEIVLAALERIRNKGGE